MLLKSNSRYINIVKSNVFLHILHLKLLFKIVLNVVFYFLSFFVSLLIILYFSSRLFCVFPLTIHDQSYVFFVSTLCLPMGYFSATLCLPVGYLVSTYGLLFGYLVFSGYHLFFLNFSRSKRERRNKIPLFCSCLVIRYLYKLSNLKKFYFNF